MTRPTSLLTGLMVIPGWLAAPDAPADGRLAAMVVALMAGRAVTNIVNDVLDEEKDGVTAPHLPLPSGTVPFAQAALAGGALSICMVAALAIAAGSWGGFLIGAAGLAAGGVCVGIYSFVKPYAALAMVATDCVYLSLPVTAWLVAGGGWSTEVWLVFAYAALRGAAAYVFSTLRDVDSDGEVGNDSLAVRLGPSRSLFLGVALEIAAQLCVVGVAIELDRELLGGVVVLASVLFLAAGYATARRAQRNASTRHQRSLAMVPLAIARHQIAIVLVQSIPIGLLAAAVSAVVIYLEATFYDRRVVHGELRRELEGGRRSAGLRLSRT
jgi:4-hydroxybenzoate polyprenyltransferase